jgi:hypothetical protein
VAHLEPVSGAPSDVTPVSGAAPSADQVIEAAPTSPADAGRHGQHETAPTSPAPALFPAPAVPPTVVPPPVVSTGAPPNAGPFSAAPTAGAPFNNPQADQVVWSQPAAHRRLNNAALAAMIVSLASFVTCPLIGLVGVYLGMRAKREIRANGEDGDGMATAGVVVGWVSTGLAVLIILTYAFIVAFVLGAAVADNR